MKLRNVTALLAALLMLFTLSSCSKTTYHDGTYKAELSEFSNSGWKDFVEVTIEGGAITKINWDSIYKDESIPIRKKQYSKSGLYGMLAGGAIDEWYDQTIAAEDFVLTNGIDALVTNEDGYTDAIAGCTIHVSEFAAMVRECLAQAERTA